MIADVLPSVPIELLPCSSCGVPQPPDQFEIRRDARCGRRRQCLACRRFGWTVQRVRKQQSQVRADLEEIATACTDAQAWYFIKSMVTRARGGGRAAELVWSHLEDMIIMDSAPPRLAKRFALALFRGYRHHRDAFERRTEERTGDSAEHRPAPRRSTTVRRDARRAKNAMTGSPVSKASSSADCMTPGDRYTVDDERALLREREREPQGQESLDDLMMQERLSVPRPPATAIGEATDADLEHERRWLEQQQPSNRPVSAPIDRD